MNTKAPYLSMKNYATKSEIVLDWYLIALAIMMKKIWKEDLIQMAIYLWKKG